MKQRNLIAALVLLAFSGGYAYMTANLPDRGIENMTEPSFFPWIVTTLLLTLTSILLVQSLLPSQAAAAWALSAAAKSKVAQVLGLFAVYVAVLPSLGFLVASVPFFGGMMAVYGERRPLWLVLGSIGVSVGLFYLFRLGFTIYLPVGVLKGMI